RHEPAVLVGSHLDSVVLGGRYDGTYGVLAGLAAIRSLREEGFAPRRPIWLAAWMDEEGARFGWTFFGSRAFAGDDLEELAGRRDAGGRMLRDVMGDWGLDFDGVAAASALDGVGQYLELHIEQGPVLDERGIDLGVVTAIVGLRCFRAAMLGAANHAGTTPMSMRRDALAGAARAALALRDLARSRDDLTANVGIMRAEPGGINIVPGRAEFTVDIRSPDPGVAAGLGRLVEETLEGIAAEESLGLELEELIALPPVPMDPALQDALERACRGEGVVPLRMPSGAGHDAMILGTRVPAGMLFVPSEGGVSHSPDERTSPEHCDLGARVLARTLRELAG
ncbi:MAG TPA: Zn-dependent hydrolase, partial [Miltoncostaeaceae bacterium]|nr:Zn-dependent hydrolase [Miltoncostaeaceae bacterium]